jgi:hypothetical protein
MSESQQQYINRVFVNRFESHLDECAQCRNEVFNPCRIGAILLRASVQTIPDSVMIPGSMK